MANSRNCDINPDGGNLTVTITANNGLRAGGRFGIYNMSKELGENWSLSAGDEGEQSYQMTTPVNKLSGQELTWRVKTCALIPGSTSGTIGVAIMQDGKPCPMSSTVQWTVDNVPTCESAKALQKTFSLIFQNELVIAGRTA